MLAPSEMVYEMDIDQINQSCYDQQAARWDRFPFPDQIPSLVKKHYRSSLGNKVLDVGSGTGMLAEWLAGKGFDVLCLDPSREMVSRCRARGLSTIQTSIQAYQPEGSFGMVFAILSLIHVPKKDFAEQVRKLTEALVSKGLFFLAMLEGEGEAISENKHYPRFFSYYSREEIERQVGEYGSLVEYSCVRSGGIGYMLFLFEKK